MLPNTNPFGFAPPHNLLQQKAITPTAGVMPATPAGAGMAMASPATVDPSQFAIQPQPAGPGPEVNAPMALPGTAQPTGMAGPPPQLPTGHQMAIHRLRGFNPNNGKPY